jgi:hypothetical protein
MTSLNIPSGKKSEDLPYLYWIPKLHKTPYKERYIAGSSTCATKELSIHLTKILSAVKEGQQKYCETVYSRSGNLSLYGVLKRDKRKSISAEVNKKHFKELTKYKNTVIDTTLPKFINLFSSKANLLGRTTR